MQVNTLGWLFQTKGLGMSKHIQFKQDVGEYKKGAFAELADPVANQFVTMGVAELAPDDLAQRAVAMSMVQMGSLIEAQLEKRFAELISSNKKSLGPGQNGDTSVGNFARPKHVVQPGDWSDPTSEVDKRRNPGGWFRNIIKAQLNRDANAHRELVTPWEEGGYGCLVSDGSGDVNKYHRGMVEGIGSAGGYTTPVIYESQVFAVAAEKSVLVSRARQVPLGARQVEFPALNQYMAPSRGQAAWFGGMQIFRKSESTQRTEVDLAFKKIQLLAQDLTAYTELSRDLIMDSTIPIDSYVVKMMGDAIGWREDWEAFNGTGEGQFEGIMNAPALLSYTRHIATSFATYPAAINYADVFGMKSRMLIGAQDPVWFVHPFSLPLLEGIVSPSGAFAFIANLAITNQQPTQNIGGYQAIGGGGSVAGGVVFRPSGYLLGHPVFATEKVPPPSTTAATSTTTYGPKNQLLFVDCQSYWVGRRSGLEVGLSEHFKFDTDQLAIRAKMRNDGKPGQLYPITLSDGAATANQVSGFVTLAQAESGA